MKYAKMLGLLAVAAAALMAFASSASATTLTSNGSIYSGEIHAVAGETTLHGAATITCLESTVSGTIETQSDTTTAHGPISTLTFGSCTPNYHVTVLKPGRLIVHTHEKDPEGLTGNGTVTSDGAEVTIDVTGLGIDCIYTTKETDIGTLTGSHTTKTTATIHIEGTISRTGGSIFCGSSGKWTGDYTVTTPDNLDVDHPTK